MHACSSQARTQERTNERTNGVRGEPPSRTSHEYVCRACPQMKNYLEQRRRQQQVGKFALHGSFAYARNERMLPLAPPSLLANGMVNPGGMSKATLSGLGEPENRLLVGPLRSPQRCLGRPSKIVTHTHTPSPACLPACLLPPLPSFLPYLRHTAHQFSNSHRLAAYQLRCFTAKTPPAPA